LKQRRRNELEQLLSVFDQSNRTSDNHILNVREEDFPEKFRSIIRRLQKAAKNKTLKKKMEREDRHLLYIQDVERGAHYKGIAEGEAKVRKEMEGIVAQKDSIIAQNALALEAERQKNEKLMQELDQLKQKFDQ
jgi:hypothetical protein